MESYKPMQHFKHNAIIKRGFRGYFRRLWICGGLGVWRSTLSEYTKNCLIENILEATSFAGCRCRFKLQCWTFNYSRKLYDCRRSLDDPTIATSIYAKWPFGHLLTNLIEECADGNDDNRKWILQYLCKKLLLRPRCNNYRKNGELVICRQY